MTTSKKKPTLLHHWLRLKGDVIFHAYPSGRPGQKTLCEEGQRIGEIREIQLPGDRSVVCSKCMQEVNGCSIGGKKR